MESYNDDSTLEVLRVPDTIYAKQKHLGCKKSARPIRSSIVNSCMRPKSLISVKAKKFSLG